MARKAAHAEVRIMGGVVVFPTAHPGSAGAEAHQELLKQQRVTVDQVDAAEKAVAQAQLVMENVRKVGLD